TKLSLLLKVLEGENAETLGKSLRLFHERALPDLGDNIKCGNSLIGPDFYEGKQLSLLDDEERYRINVFDWEAEFPETMNAGGFDIVIGNPPWGGDLTMEEKQYLMRKFAHVHMRTPDTFNYFLAQGCAVSSPNGRLGMIIPNNFLFQHEYAKARQFFVQEMCLAAAINLGDSVFAVTAPCCVVVIEHSKAGKTQNTTAVADLRNIERCALALTLNAGETVTVDAEDILTSPDCTVPMNKDATKRIARILRRIPTLLGDICDQVASGIGTGGDKVFRIEDKAAKLLGIERDLLHPVLIGREMNAYYVPKETGHSIIYSTKAISGKTHPKALEYLKSYQAKLAQKRETRKGLIPWWSLHWPRYPELFNAPKIVLRQTANSLYASLDEIGYYCLDSIIIIRPKDADLMKYYIGLLNSCLVRWIYNNLTQEQYRTFPQVKSINLRKLPIRTIDFTNSTDKALHDRMVELVETMLKLHKDLRAAKTDHDKKPIQRQIDTTDKQIDQLVYELYDLTDEEIRIVEEATK
ncbi:MAG: N-6 DNA methylase, partial [Dehalococcoidia bacterium]|nr:N-6 DNA methylase [Dehalococcoidia bacterium]